MSATLDAAPLERYLAPCAVLAAAGRTFPVHQTYLDAPADFLRLAVDGQRFDRRASIAVGTVPASRDVPGNESDVVV